MTCNNSPRGVPCQQQASHWLVTPEGTRCPGVVCETCAQRAISQYREILDEAWSMEPCTDP